MDSLSFTQRMLGAIVLLSLAIIFIPMLLEKESEISGGITGTNIPAMPENVSTLVFQMDGDGLFKALNKQKDQGRETSILEALKDTNTEIPLFSEESIPDTVEPHANAEVILQADKKEALAWMVQIASFRSEKNANRLRDRLRTLNYPTVVKKRSGSKGDIWAVRVGPELTLDKAKQLKKGLKSETDLEGLILRHH